MIPTNTVVFLQPKCKTRETKGIAAEIAPTELIDITIPVKVANRRLSNHLDIKPKAQIKAKLMPTPLTFCLQPTSK